MFCKNCGTVVDENTIECPHCGTYLNYSPNKALRKNNVSQNAERVNTPHSNVAKVPEVDAPNTGFAVLGFFFPLVGLILFCVWNNVFPLKAKSCGKGALIGCCVEVGLSIIITIITVVILSVL